jgi:hypothetical protein
MHYPVYFAYLVSGWLYCTAFSSHFPTFFGPVSMLSCLKWLFCFYADGNKSANTPELHFFGLIGYGEPTGYAENPDNWIFL